MLICDRYVFYGLLCVGEIKDRLGMKCFVILSGVNGSVKLGFVLMVCLVKCVCVYVSNVWYWF